MITDYDQFFRPTVTKIHNGPIFHMTHIFETSKNKDSIFQTQKSGENKLCFLRPVSVSATHSLEIWEPLLPALLRNGHKQTFKWSDR